MEQTSKGTLKYGSEPNINTSVDKSWVSSRHNKNKRDRKNSDSEDSISQESRRYKSTCCTASDVLNETLSAFREEMKSMHNLLNEIKEDQEENYVRIKADISEIKGEILEIKIKSIENEKVIEVVENNYKEICKKQQDYVECSKKHENMLKDLMQKNTYLDKYNKSLEERIRLLEQKEFDLDIELVNVEAQEGENVADVVKNIAKELKINNDNISKAWRIKGQNRNNKPKPIIVTLRTREARNMWLKSNKLALTNHIIYKNNNTDRIYINERITRQTRQLFWSAKLQLKDEFKFIWLRNGKILLRKKEGEKKIESIECESDIKNLLNKSNIKNNE